MFKHDCKIHGHRFEARYSEEFTNALSDFFDRITKVDNTDSLIKLTETCKLKLYRYDICTKCGKIIKNKE